MYQFFETIKIVDNKGVNLPMHQQRVNKTFKVFYPDFEPLDLAQLLLDILPEGKINKCKICYNATFYDVHYSKYQEVVQNQFKIVEANGYDYSFKFTDRSYFENIKAQYPDHEIIFIQNGMVTDTTYANLVFFADNQWFTPETTLLKGTQRAYLLEQRKIDTLTISKEEIKDFKKFKLINSMLSLDNSTEYYTDMIEF